MRILKESKENIPAEFITSFISKGWEEVGALKAEISAISKEFSGTKQVEETLQDLLDAYLVAIGKFQGYLSTEKMVVLPEDDKATNESLKENLEEDAVFDITIDNVTIEPKETEQIAEPEIVVEPEAAIAIEKSTQPIEEFDYFCDFEDPDPLDEPLTDDDLYPRV